MVTKEERDRARNDSRHIGELDERQRRKDRQDEIDRARQEGIFIERIQQLQLSLKRSQTPVEELEQLPLEALTSLADELQTLAFPPA